MKVLTSGIGVRTRGECDVVNITNDVQDAISATGVKEGMVNLFVIGSTSAITTIEYEPGLVNDLEKVLQRLVPKGAGYEHEKAWNDDNGHSHLRASLIGPSLTVPLMRGKLKLGTWQQIVLIELDTRPREREVVVQAMGE
jgi:secondary thiamine-phosphate synthase enzyme